VTGYWGPPGEPRSVPVRRRTPAETLRWLADQLDAGQDPSVVAVVLVALGAQLDDAERVAPPPEPV
jgi:hypothetical protein